MVSLSLSLSLTHSLSLSVDNRRQVRVLVVVGAAAGFDFWDLHPNIMFASFGEFFKRRSCNQNRQTTADRRRCDTKPNYSRSAMMMMNVLYECCRD